RRAFGRLPLSVRIATHYREVYYELDSQRAVRVGAEHGRTTGGNRYRPDRSGDDERIVQSIVDGIVQGLEVEPAESETG
ncbi:hypothetical protein OAS39_10900, partial [Pirellulales bacterium]|nr:hypothetical protein [Pirellulales bacterium]